MEKYTADSVDESVALIGERRWGAVPVKSTWIVPSPIVTLVTTLIGSSTTPSSSTK